MAASPPLSPRPTPARPASRSPTPESPSARPWPTAIGASWRGDSLAGGAYSLAAGVGSFSGAPAATNLRLVKRATSAAPWAFEGTAGGNGATSVVRDGMAGFSEFAVATPNSPAVVGASAALGAWNTGASAVMYDDGTHGDAVAGDGIFTRSADISTTPSEWKVLKDQSLGWAAGNTLGREADGQNMADLGTTGTITYYYDTRNLTAQNWAPATVSLGSSQMQARTWVAVGDFQAAAGNPTDWDPVSAVTVMHDDGLNGDAVAGDGIYTFQFTTTSALGAKVWKANSTTSGGWSGSLRLGVNGWSVDPGDSANQSFSALINQVVTLEGDLIHGHVRATVTDRTGVNEWSMY